MALGGKGKYYEDDKQDLENAMKLLTESITLDSSNEETMWHLGTVNAKRGNNAEAIKWFTRLTTIRPNDPTIWGGLEWAYTLAGDTAKATECKQKAAQLTQQPKDTK
jgi:Flp pilus assembly protein TadD